MGSPKKSQLLLIFDFSSIIPLDLVKLMVSTFRTSFPQILDHHPRLIHPDWPAHSFRHVTKPSKNTPCHPHIAYRPLPTNCQHNFSLHLYMSRPTTRRQYDRHDILSWSWLQFENLLWPAVLPSGLLCTPQQTSPFLPINKSLILNLQIFFYMHQTQCLIGGEHWYS